MHYNIRKSYVVADAAGVPGGGPQARRRSRRSGQSPLARRKAAWVCPEPKVKTGYLARYAKLVSSADKGAILQ